jgi:hypothetical protein
MKPPDLLGAPADSASLKTPDGFLVKYKGLKAWLARLMWFIPLPGTGITVTMTADGPKWNASGGGATARPFAVDQATRKMAFGVVGGLVPTYGGIAIGSPSTPAFPTGTYTIYLKLTFTVTFDAAGALISWPLASVSVETTFFSETTAIKRLPCGSCAAGTFSNSAFSGSLSVSLCNNAANQTSLTYNAA